MKLKFTNEKFDLRQIAAWTIFVISLAALLLYGLSYFFTKPKMETVTVQPSNSNASNKAYMNQTQDVRFKHKSSK
ncbi:MAG TPA: hypothetical protein PKY59_14225 [Pyrinomonadaceae bacterium]|nr:hypothetical protein [Pyrinomonadaceae bacterium]